MATDSQQFFVVWSVPDGSMSYTSPQAAVLTTAIVRVYQTWGQEQLRQGHVGDAARLFRTALEMDSTNGELYFAHSPGFSGKISDR